MSLFTIIPKFIVSGYKDKDIPKDKIAEDMQKLAEYTNRLNENQLYLYRNVRELRQGIGKAEKTHELTHKIAVKLKDLLKEEKQIKNMEKHLSDSRELVREFGQINKKQDKIDEKIAVIEKEIEDKTGHGKNLDFLAGYISVIHDNQKKIVKEIMDLTTSHDSVNQRVKHVHDRTIGIIKDVERLVSKEDIVAKMRNSLDNLSSHTNMHASAITSVRRRLSEVEKIKGFGPKILGILTSNEKNVVLAVAKAKKPLNYREISVKVGFKEKTVQKLVSSIMKRCNILLVKDIGEKKQKFFWIDSKYKKDVVSVIQKKLKVNPKQ